MTVRVCPLASGSLGNAMLVVSEKARVLVDMGTPQKRLKSGLKQAGVAPQDLAAVFLTHTHKDHFSDVSVGFCLTHGIRVHSSEENLRYLARHMRGFRDLAAAGLAVPIDGQVVEVEDIAVEAFDVPHDAPGRCLGYRLAIGPARARRTVAVATDLGHMPADCLARFIDADVIVLESNHDPEMLRASNRPADLIERIAGPEGHLSNEDSAEAAAEIVSRSHPGRVKHLVLAHLSRDCNRPDLALEAHAHLARRHADPVRISTAEQFQPGPMIEM